MIETAEVVAERYGVSRERQDEYALQSQQRTAQAQAEGRFDREIAPMTTVMKVLVNKETGETADKEITISADEGNRPQTTLADLQKLQPVFKGGRYVKEGKFITAGNASQLSDGAAAVLLMEAQGGREARPGGARRLSRHGGRRLRPGGDGHRPGVRDPQAAGAQRPEDRRHRHLGAERGLRRRRCSIAATSWASTRTKYNVSGGSISIGHPYGMTGARCTGHLLLRRQAPRREVRRRHHVRRRRHGRGGAVRDLLSGR